MQSYTGEEGRICNMCSLVGGAAGGTDCGGAKLDREHRVAGHGAGHVARVLARAAVLSSDRCSVRGDTRNVRAEQLAQLRARGGQHELVARHAAGVRADEDDVRVARILQQPGVSWSRSYGVERGQELVLTLYSLRRSSEN